MICRRPSGMRARAFSLVDAEPSAPEPRPLALVLQAPGKEAVGVTIWWRNLLGGGSPCCAALARVLVLQVENRRLTAEEHSQDVRHLGMDIAGSVSGRLLLPHPCVGSSFPSATRQCLEGPIVAMLVLCDVSRFEPVLHWPLWIPGASAEHATDSACLGFLLCALCFTQTACALCAVGCALFSVLCLSLPGYVILSRRRSPRVALPVL